MQCFLPYPDFEKSMKVLDYRRLGKQRVEAKMIVDIIVYGKESSWKNHPAVLMWKGYFDAIINYYNESLYEWKKRGYKNILLKPIEYSELKYWMPPFWLHNERLHSSHRAALLYKNYEWYSQFGWTEEPKIDYYWPVRKGNGNPS